MGKFAWLCFLFPFAGVIATPVLAGLHHRLRDYGAVFFSFLAALASMSLIPLLFRYPSGLPIESSFCWLAVPIVVEFGILIDHLSIILANVVAVISFIIMVYSLGYMKEDPSLTRYWMFMNAFIGSMLLLVLANNLLFVFMGWKLVGLCSWGLIGFYYKDERQYWLGGPSPTPYWTPSQAGLKALIVTGAGDVFLLAGILILFFYAQTFNLLALYKTSSMWMPEMAKTPGIVILVSILLLAGPVGKSAQFPLHEWLPEAMAGPTTVSALIHAATMVKSGVYLVARLVPIFYYGYWVAGCSEASSFFIMVAWIGVITAFVAATQGMVALELKKVLAFSTVSQIGYMWLGLGLAGLNASVLVGGLTSGIFHLVSHALFKACLFLCAGSVLHAAHSIYLSDMGSLKKYMPYTWLFMLIAALSLMGIPPFPGFWSKDAILVASAQGHHYFLLIMALITVSFTSFYTVRCMGMIFHGPGSENVKRLRRAGAHLDDGYRTMWGACGVLAVMIVLIGVFGPQVEHLLRAAFQTNVVEKLNLPVHAGTHSGHRVVPVLSVVFVFVGAVPAYFLYISQKLDPTAILGRYPILEKFRQLFWDRWHIEDFYQRCFVGGTMKVSRIVAVNIEDAMDKIYHRKLVGAIIRTGALAVKFVENPLDRFYHVALPELVKKRAYTLIRQLQTEAKDLAFNIAYVLLLFVVMVFLFMALQF